MSSYEYTEEPPPIEERDAALGRYMDAWSRLETTIHWVTQEILNIEPDAGYVIWSTIPTFQTIKLLEAAAKIRFNDEGQKRTAKICEKLTRRNTRRNYIVHGSWLTSIRMSFAGQPPAYGEWRRVYTHTNPDLPNSDDGSDVTVPQMNKTTDHVEEMIQALSTLEQDIPSLLVRPRTPAQ